MPRNCEWCGEEFAARRAAQFCSKSCAKYAHYADKITYTGAHLRVRRLKGPASQQVCIDCGQPAQHWSYDGLDPDELVSTAKQGKGQKYSVRPEYYQARCVVCHQRMDDGAFTRTGERHHNSKLTDAQRRGVIASVLRSGDLVRLARHLGVTTNTIRRIRKGQGK